ncbi:MAG: hypothetical protein ACXVCY_16000 [Pseudobdellovibrionaceae bacterium]
MKILKLYLTLTVLAVVACGPKQGNDRLTEKAKLEGKAGMEGQIEYQNQRSKEVERDLERKYALYAALEGSYDGVLTTERGEFQVRLTMVPNLSKLKMNRQRTSEEIIYDLNTLSMNTQIIQWRPNSPNSAIGCMVNQVRPDFARLSLAIASETCPSFYKFELTLQNEQHKVLNADEVLQHVDANQKIIVTDIIGQIKPNTNARIYSVSLKKVEAHESEKKQ